MENYLTENIKTLREAYGLTLVEMEYLVTEKKNNHGTLIWMWERGKVSPNLSNLYKISRAFDIPMEKLMTQPLVMTFREDKKLPVYVKINVIRKRLDEKRIIEHYRNLNSEKKDKVKKFIRKVSKKAA